MILLPTSQMLNVFVIPRIKLARDGVADGQVVTPRGSSMGKSLTSSAQILYWKRLRSGADGARGSWASRVGVDSSTTAQT